MFFFFNKALAHISKMVLNNKTIKMNLGKTKTLSQSDFFYVFI